MVLLDLYELSMIQYVLLDPYELSKTAGSNMS
jgi:hypothetical protein